MSEGVKTTPHCEGRVSRFTGHRRTHKHESSELPRRSGRMTLSRVGGTSKMLHGVDLLPRRLRAEAPSGSARTIQKGICCIGACTKSCIEYAMSSLALGTPRWVSPSLKRAYCTHGHPARGHCPGRPAAGEARCVSTEPHRVFVQSHCALRSTSRRDHQRET